jgi:fibronectin type 3 domain-containing protein
MSYSLTLAATGGTTPYTWSLTSGTLPGGLNLNASTGLISGTPTAVANATALTFKVNDSTVPTSQTNTVSLTITITGPSVLLSWVASTSPATSGYNVYRSSTSGSGYTRINVSTVLGLTYTDTIVVSGQTYYYVTTAVDSSGDESPFSNQIQATIP